MFDVNLQIAINHLVGEIVEKHFCRAYLNLNLI